MKADAVALRGDRAAPSIGIDQVFRGITTTLLTDVSLPTSRRDDPAELIALLSERRTLPVSLVDTLDTLREQAGDFVVASLDTPKPTCGFTAKPVEPLDVTELRQLVWRTHDTLDTLYQSFEPTDPVALAYRSIIIDVRSHLKSFLLELSTKNIDQGLNPLEKPAFLASCISLENYLGQTVQRVEGVRLEAEEDTNV
jgi:hypothetical protein